jgi:L-2-hydroxyglutarate oxidase
LVATNEIELRRLENLVERAKRNQIRADRVNAREITTLEPYIRGLEALLIHDTAIVNYKEVCEAIYSVITGAGGTIEFETQVSKIQERGSEVLIVAGEREWHAKKLVVCAGLQSDRLANLSGIRAGHRIVPFRGEYFVLGPDRKNLVKRLIYPIPDPNLPFLGIHFTRMIDGGILVGPNAVLGFAREGYPKGSFKSDDVVDYLRFPGFWKAIGRDFSSGLREFRNSIFKTAYLNECRKYCLTLELSDLHRVQAGIRAQAIMRDGSLAHDFLFLQTDRMLHVCNAPSPAATSALPIADMIADKILSIRFTTH